MQSRQLKNSPKLMTANKPAPPPRRLTIRQLRDLSNKKVPRVNNRQLAAKKQSKKL